MRGLQPWRRHGLAGSVEPSENTSERNSLHFRVPLRSHRRRRAVRSCRCLAVQLLTMTRPSSRSSQPNAAAKVGAELASALAAAADRLSNTFRGPTPAAKACFEDDLDALLATGSRSDTGIMVIFPRGSDWPQVRALARVRDPRLATPAMPASPPRRPPRLEASQPRSFSRCRPNARTVPTPALSARYGPPSPLVILRRHLRRAILGPTTLRITSAIGRAQDWGGSYADDAEYSRPPSVLTGVL